LCLPTKIASNSSNIANNNHPVIPPSRRALTNLNNNSMHDACRVPVSACDLLNSSSSSNSNNNNLLNSSFATVPSSTNNSSLNNSINTNSINNSNNNKNNLILGKLYSTSSSTSDIAASDATPPTGSSLKQKIARITAEANKDFVRTEVEQRVVNVQSIQRQITTSVAESAAKQKEEEADSSKTTKTSLSGVVNRAKEGLQSSATTATKTAATPANQSATASAAAAAANASKLDTFDMSIDTAIIANRILTRPLLIKDLDFTDLTAQDDVDISRFNAIPPPPPPLNGFTVPGGKENQKFLNFLI